MLPLELEFSLLFEKARKDFVRHLRNQFSRLQDKGLLLLCASGYYQSAFSVSITKFALYNYVEKKKRAKLAESRK